MLKQMHLIFLYSSTLQEHRLAIRPSFILCWHSCRFSVETGTLGDKHLKALYVKEKEGLSEKGLNTEMNK